jgi:hypothetical protein
MYSISGELPASFEAKKLNDINIRFPDKPTHLTFLHTMHEGMDDFPEDIIDLVDEHDVILLESPSWTQDDQELVQAISDGDGDALKYYDEHIKGSSSFFNALPHTFFASRKQIRFCDLPGTNKTLDLIERRVELADKPFKTKSVADFVQAGRAFFDFSIKEFCYRRDRHMLRTIYTQLTAPEAVQSLPAASGLFIVGALHKAIPHVIRRQVSLQDRPDQTISTRFVGDTRESMADAYFKYLQGESYTDVEVLKGYLRFIATNDPTTVNRIFDMSYDEAVHELFTPKSLEV